MIKTRLLMGGTAIFVLGSVIAVLNGNNLFAAGCLASAAAVAVGAYVAWTYRPGY